ncbi:MAG: hypothetical protein NT049_06455 [Planctomycetota bacterium]|nr:hypothetical protein [Planctomycetota bacterium]
MRFLMAAIACLSFCTGALGASPYFGIKVIDEQTGRGVPLVELETVDAVKYYTDSAGWVAFSEPGLMNQQVFFSVKGHGYEAPKDGFGIRGVRFQVKEGGRAEIKLKRLNIAERLYRITGEGIYRDSVLLGEKVPIREPLLNAQVLGQDSVQAVPYRGKIYWIWGDTQRLSYPLGHFRTAGATSEMPGKGGLDPSVGVDLTYFAGKDGFSRPMAPMPEFKGGTMIWVFGIMTVPDSSRGELLVAKYTAHKSLSEVIGLGLVVFNDETGTFEKAAEFDIKEPWRYPDGNAIRITEGKADHYLFPHPFPVVRAPARLDDLKNPAKYEAFTCLAPGTKYTKGDAKVERDPDGKAVWGWKPDTDPVSQPHEGELIQSGKLKADEAHFQLVDAESGKPVTLHYGSFCWNAYRKKWLLIGVQQFGTSFLGEVWAATAAAPTGPWGKARKIVTHEKYSFYNPAQHPFFDQEGGRIIYFEGTYAETFSGAPFKTPRYDYNQIMYRLDLADPRLAELP